jgi:hypothetical protein
MTRKLLLAAVLLAIVATPALAEEKKEADKPAAPYVHTVIFHLKKDAPKEAAAELIADCHQMLARIPTVRALRAGRPAENASPGVAKKDYAVGLMILFDNYDGLQTYLDHALHVQFVEKHGKNLDMEKLQVYDFSNQKK